MIAITVIVAIVATTATITQAGVMLMAIARRTNIVIIDDTQTGAHTGSRFCL